MLVLCFENTKFVIQVYTKQVYALLLFNSYIFHFEDKFVILLAKAKYHGLKFGGSFGSAVDERTRHINIGVC